MGSLSGELDRILKVGERIFDAQDQLSYEEWQVNNVPQDCTPEIKLFASPNGRFALLNFRFTNSSGGVSAEDQFTPEAGSLILLVDVPGVHKAIELTDQTGERVVRSAVF